MGPERAGVREYRLKQLLPELMRAKRGRIGDRRWVQIGPAAQLDLVVTEALGIRDRGRPQVPPGDCQLLGAEARSVYDRSGRQKQGVAQDWRAESVVVH